MSCEPYCADAAALDPHGDSGYENQGFIAALLRQDWSLFVGARTAGRVDSVNGQGVPQGSVARAADVCPRGTDELDAAGLHQPELGPTSSSLGCLRTSSPHSAATSPLESTVAAQPGTIGELAFAWPPLR